MNKKGIALILSIKYLVADLMYLRSKNKDLIKKDFARYNGKEQMQILDFNSTLEFYKPFRSVFYYRTREKKVLAAVSRIFLPPLPGIEITCTGNIGGGLKILHNFGCVISIESAGENMTVLQGVTLGYGGPNSNGHKPKIGNNVTIATNAIVIGEVTIGDDVIIGAGAVVTKDIGAGMMVVGNPQRVISKAGNRQL